MKKLRIIFAMSFITLFFTTLASLSAVNNTFMMNDSTRVNKSQFNPKYSDVPYYGKHSVGLSYAHICLPRNPSQISTFSGIYELEGNFWVSKTTKVKVSIPYTSFSYKYNYYTTTEINSSTIGNVTLGIEQLFGKSLNTTISGGITLPSINEDNAESFPIYADYINIHKYLPNSLTSYLNISSNSSKTEAVYGGGSFGFTLLIPTESRNDSELLLNYKGTIGHEDENIGLSASLLGMMIITEDNIELSDRFLNYANFEIHYNGEFLQPQIFCQLPLRDSFRKRIDLLLGLKLNVFF